MITRVVYEVICHQTERRIPCICQVMKLRYHIMQMGNRGHEQQYKQGMPLIQSCLQLT